MIQIMGMKMHKSNLKKLINKLNKEDLLNIKLLKMIILLNQILIFKTLFSNYKVIWFQKKFKNQTKLNIIKI